MKSTQDCTGSGKSNKFKTISVAERDEQLAGLNQAVAERDGQIAGILKSKSLRITALLRWVSRQAKRAKHILNVVPVAFKHGGGVQLTLVKALRAYKIEGLEGIRRRLIHVHTQGEIKPVIGSGVFDRNDYQEWIKRYDTLDDAGRQRIHDRIAAFSRAPMISVVMPVYDPQLKFLDEAIWSVRNQLYPVWELCIADDASKNPAVRDLLRKHACEDARIKVVYREVNGHISAASNSALKIATGEFVALLDNDDLLPEHALFWLANSILENPDAVLIYSDEDKIDSAERRYAPYFKCKLNYELLLAQNMISHLGVYRRDVLEQIGGFRIGFEGSQDYDLALRVLENIAPDQVVHIPRVLYHWRAISGSTALASGEKNYAAEAGRRAVAEHLYRMGRKATVTAAPEAPALNRVRYELPASMPMVSIIISTRDRADLLSICIDSLLTKTTYSNYEVLIIDNGSVEPQTQQFFAHLPKDRVRVIRDDSPFNYSKLNNHGAAEARGDVLCLMNNDIEILTPDWMEEMVSYTIDPAVGCVGARLWYPNGCLQHGGVIVGIGGVASHSHKYFPKGAEGYFGRAVLSKSLSAVTAACLMIRKNVFASVSGLDESLPVAFNDIDFCLRVRAAGYRNVWTPYAEMNHHESASRGYEDNPKKQARFAGEVRKIQTRWGEKLLDDPAYSPNLTLDYEDFSLAWPPRIDLI